MWDFWRHLPARTMRGVIARACLTACSLMAPPMGAAATDDVASELGVEEVLVTGEHPGPGMWKVVHGEHTLWILGTHAPLPQRLTWRSQEVEWVMTEAQEVLGPYSASFTLEAGQGYELKPVKLKRLLPRRKYAQWLALKKKYIGVDEEVEKSLPAAAALVLRSAAFERAGLTSADPVWREIYTLANRYHVPVSTSHQVTKVIGGKALRDAASMKRVGVDYLINTIDQLEADLRLARERANAWASGDLALLAAHASADKNTASLYASSWPFLQDAELQAMKVEAEERWLAAAQTALGENTTTLAALPIFMLLNEGGPLDVLRERGYTVEAPVY